MARQYHMSLQLLCKMFFLSFFHHKYLHEYLQQLARKNLKYIEIFDARPFLHLLLCNHHKEKHKNEMICLNDALVSGYAMTLYIAYLADSQKESWPFEFFLRYAHCR
ncbi:hypothetical protein [Escherichia phage vB_EcoM-569R5]|nr:hypothetical protein [Escherichia phage vB_EcoM-569R5]URE76759.1 hypothetical protein [Escherichia phage vB_EcoM-705R2]